MSISAGLTGERRDQIDAKVVPKDLLARDLLEMPKQTFEEFWCILLRCIVPVRSVM